MFRLNAPVIIRVKVKEVRTNVANYSHVLLRIHVIGGQRAVRIAPPSLPPHHSGPTTREFQSSIPVEALLCRCHLNVQGGSFTTAPVLCHGPVWWTVPGCYTPVMRRQGA